MSNSNVRPISAAVNPTVEDVCKWLKQKSERGELGASSAKIRITSINSLASILADDEPKEARWLFDNIKDVASRWATLNASSPAGTVQTYESRARSSLEYYFEWLANPTGFRFKKNSQQGNEKAGKGPAKKAAKQPRPGRAHEVQKEPDIMDQSPRTERARREIRNFPLGDERSFEFSLPDDGVKVDEVKRIAFHLLTLASDLDLNTPAHAQMFALVVKKD